MEHIQAADAPEKSRRRMRAAVLRGPGDIEIVAAPRPQPGSRDVRVRIEGCGVCASNLTPWSGPEWMRFPTAPGELGHEGWGVVDAVGVEVQDLAVGDRVAVLSYRAYADYDVAPAAQVVKLPASVVGAPAPGEPLACAVNVLRRSGIEAGQSVAVVGVGFLGALLIQLAARRGAHVVAVSRRPTALRAARGAGASSVVSWSDDALRAACEANGGALFDCVIEATGAQGGLDLAGKLTRERGRLVIAGYHQDGPRVVDMQLWNWRGLDVINAHERDPAIYMAGMREAFDLVAAGAFDPGQLLTHAFPLERLGEALDATRDRPAGFMKAYVVMTRED